MTTATARHEQARKHGRSRRIRATGIARAVMHLACVGALLGSLGCEVDEEGIGWYTCVSGGDGPLCNGLLNGVSVCAISAADAFDKCFFTSLCPFDCTCEVDFSMVDEQCGLADVGQSAQYLVARQVDLKVQLDPMLSFMVLLRDGGFVAETDVAGELYFDLIGDCPGAGCSVKLEGIELAPATPFTFTLEGQSITEQRITSMSHPTVALVSDFAEFPPGSTDLISGYDRDGARRVTEFTNAVPYGAILSLQSGQFETNLVLNNNSGGQALVFLTGTIVGRPPIANAGADATACGTLTVDGSASSDPDGDIAAFLWQEGSTVLGQTALLELSLPDGTHALQLTVTDARGASDSDLVLVTIGDTSAPTLSGAATHAISVCTPEPQLVAIPVPSVSDDCDPNPSVTGAVTAIDGQLLAVPIAIDPATHSVSLPLGTHAVRWTAQDAHGNLATFDQSVSVSLLETVACCSAGQTQIAGNNLANLIVPLVPRAYCVFARGGTDTVLMPIASAGNDYLSGGPGLDTLTGRFGNDVILGGAGGDVIRGGDFGVLEAHGGAGADQIFASLASSALLYGGEGADLISGSPGADLIYPGGGSDLVIALAGDDTVVIRNECEIEAPLVIDGGAGSDQLIAPVSQAELLALGVISAGFENYVVDTSQRHLAECF